MLAAAASVPRVLAEAVRALRRRVVAWVPVVLRVPVTLSVVARGVRAVIVPSLRPGLVHAAPWAAL
jgi:hypothetical protein